MKNKRVGVKKSLFSMIAVLFLTLAFSCSVQIDPNQGKSAVNSGNSGKTYALASAYAGRLTGVNWFGFETGNLCPHGLWSRDYKSMLQQIKDLGFNCIRMPWCGDMLTGTPTSIQVNAYGVDAYTKQLGLNTDLAGLNSVQVMDKIVSYCDTLGIKIILDRHSAAHDGYMNETLWYTASSPESKFISDWLFLVNRYKNNPSVVGADLKNEPHGNMTSGMKPPATWGYDEPGQGTTDWKAAAERCGQAILAANPNLLIIVEGTEEFTNETYWWGGNLSGVGVYPITAIPKGNLMYSAHEYGPEVFNQSWFTDPTFPNNMPAIWDKHFWFIYKQGIAPLFFGEFGILEASASDPTSTPYKWLTTFMAYVGNKASWTFWCFNPDSGDTGGILQDDWVTVNTAKYNIIKPYLAAFDNSGTGQSSSVVVSSSSSAPVISSSSTAPKSSSSSSAPVISSSSTAPKSSSSSSTPVISSSSSSSSSAVSSSSSGVVYTTITAPFVLDGAGTYHWKIAVVPSFINDWNLTTLNINGVSFLNLWVSPSQLPAQQGGYYYIDYTGPYAWSHIEIK